MCGCVFCALGVWDLGGPTSMCGVCTVSVMCPRGVVGALCVARIACALSVCVFLRQWHVQSSMYAMYRVCVLCTRGVAFALHIASVACGCVSVKGQQVFRMCQVCLCCVSSMFSVGRGLQGSQTSALDPQSPAWPPAWSSKRRS